VPAKITRRPNAKCPRTTPYSSCERRFRTIGPTTYHHSQTTPPPNKVRPTPKGCGKIDREGKGAAARTAGATNRHGRARALETDKSIFAVVTRCRNAPVSQCARTP
jgi:hypothetical protein